MRAYRVTVTATLTDVWIVNAADEREAADIAVREARSTVAVGELLYEVDGVELSEEDV